MSLSLNGYGLMMSPRCSSCSMSLTSLSPCHLSRCREMMWLDESQRLYCVSLSRCRVKLLSRLRYYPLQSLCPK